MKLLDYQARRIIGEGRTVAPNRASAVTAWLVLVNTMLLASFGCSQESPTAPSAMAPTANVPASTPAIPDVSGPSPDVSGVWNGTSTLSAVTGGDCAADMIRGGRTVFRRRMTISQVGSSITVALSARGAGIADETWSGSIDAAGRVTATWQPAGGSDSIDYICDPRTDSRTRRAIRRTGVASLSFLHGSAVIEGTITTRSDVAGIFGRMFPELVETTTERFAK